ncbi:hypothetical protein D3C87_1169660 [compost metagenome]
MPTAHSKLRRDIDHFFEVNKIRVDVVAETQDTSLQNLLGCEGVGLIPVAKKAVAELIRDKKIMILGALPGVKEEIWLTSASRRIENPIAASLMKNFKIEDL